MNMKAVKDSYNVLLSGGWLGDKTNSKSVVPRFGSDRVVEVSDCYVLLDSASYNCPLIRKEDGIITVCDRCSDWLFKQPENILKNVIREFTPEEFKNFLETELKKAS